jgi:hypothetical protein
MIKIRFIEKSVNRKRSILSIEFTLKGSQITGVNPTIFFFKTDIFSVFIKLNYFIVIALFSYASEKA